ncbi:MAG TPA: energy transducer TonB [Candidatus Angelobacter sp.]|nr:energy transducer TonB [Candidatus Angelobacter sp.]
MLTISAKRLVFSALLLLTVTSFCQSPQATAPKAQTPEEYLHSLSGQKLLMLHFGDDDHAKVKKGDLHKVKISCDLAVQIQAVRYKEREVTFDWVQIGTPQATKNFPHNCRDRVYHGRGTLTITQLASDETANSLAESVSKVLQTPEQYLATEGVPFLLPPKPDGQKLVSGTLIPPRPLLFIDGAFSQQALRSRYAGAVTISFIVGTDGLAHQPKITRPLGMGLDEQALAVLPLWRFQPGSKDGKPVAASLNIEMEFDLH